MINARTNYASRSDRLIGQFLDWLVAAGPMLLVMLAAGVSDILPVIAGTMATIWAPLYWFFSDGLSGGQSLGKRVLSIRVVHGGDRRVEVERCEQ